MLITAEPTPALSTGTEPIAADVIGDIDSAMPRPPRIIAGSSVQKSDVTLEAREEQERDRRAAPCRAPIEPARGRSGPTAFPAIGATRMISIVIGRNVAPAFVGE